MPKCQFLHIFVASIYKFAMPETKFQGLERRRFPRIPFWYIVKYRVCTQERKPAPKLFTSQSKNISLGGILLETNHCYPSSTIIEVELDVPIDTKKHVYAKVIGNVVRSTVLEQDKAYDTAIEFLSIPKEYRLNVLQLINAFS